MTPLQRLARYVRPLRTRQGILARAALGEPDPGDERLATELAAAATAALHHDGTVAGGAVPTLWRAHELLDLGLAPDDRAVARIVGWLLGQQDQPGTYGEGCDKPRHAQRICHHHLHGFFSPAPRAARLAPITMPNGKVFRAEPAARFASSCLGLRLALRVGFAAHPGVARHVESLRLLAGQWTEWTGFFAPDVIVSGLHALAHAGATERPTVERLVELVSAHQGLGGFWQNADAFATMDALLATGLPEAQRVMRRAAPALAERQRPDGSFGATAQDERALIGIRALLRAEQRY